MGSDPRSEIFGAQFIKNDRLFVTTQQLTDFSLSGAAEGSYRTRTQVLDLNGEVRARQKFDFDNGAAYIAQRIKDPSGNWAEHFLWYARDRKPISIAGFSNDPNIIFVSNVEGRDHDAIYEYDIAQRKLGEVAFVHPYFSASGGGAFARASGFRRGLGL